MSDEEDNYDEFGNKLLGADDNQMDEGENGATKREFDLTSQLGDALGNVPEHL